MVATDLGFHALVFDEHDVARLLRAAVEREGGQSAFAKHHGVDRAYLNMILNGKRPVSDSIAGAVGKRCTSPKVGEGLGGNAKRALVRGAPLPLDRPLCRCLSSAPS
jgi:hypothetical protein